MSKLRKILLQIDQNDLADFRIKWHKKQKGICPILKQEIPYNKIAVDHKHKRKKDPIGVNGGGLIRGVVQIQANALEGKIINNFKRLGLEKFITLPEFLRNLADYLDHPPIPQIYIHPNEKEKILKIKKNWFNKINKQYQEKYPGKKPLKYPKSGKMTKILHRVCHDLESKPEYKKG